jgi:hypothetical protein
MLCAEVFMRRTLLLISLSLLAAKGASAQGETIVSCCTGTANPNGAYGSTDLPRTSFAVAYNGSGAKLNSSRVTIYLGVRCDAHSPQYGNGSWGWANGGTRVNFADGRAIGFPRQVLSDLVDRSKAGCSF